MLRTKTLLATLLLTVGLSVGVALAQSDTVVPGQQTDNGSYPVGTVTGVYEYTSGGFHVQVQYRGDFEGTPSLENGWIKNIFTRLSDGAKWHYIIVHETDSRYTGNGTSVWGSWEYHLRLRANQSDPVKNGVFDLNKPQSANN